MIFPVRLRVSARSNYKLGKSVTVRQSRSCGRQRAAERSVCKNQSGSAQSTKPLACSFSARQSCWADPADASYVCVI